MLVKNECFDILNANNDFKSCQELMKDETEFISTFQKI